MDQLQTFVSALRASLADKAADALRHDDPNEAAISAALTAVREAVDEAAQAAGMETE